MSALSLVAPAVAATAAVAAPRRTLFDVMEHLQAVTDSAEMVVAEQEQEFLADLEAAKLSAREKIDKVAGFIAACEAQNAGAAAEVIRLRARQQYFAACVERMESYVLGTVMRQEPDAKGRYAPLVGDTSTFAAKRNPPSVCITNEAAVPPEYKAITLTMPLPFWESLLDSLDMDLCSGLLTQITSQTVACQKAALKPALQAGPVEGAHLVADKYHLVRT